MLGCIEFMNVIIMNRITDVHGHVIEDMNGEYGKENS